MPLPANAVELATTLDEMPDTLTFRAIRAQLDTWQRPVTIPKALQQANEKLNAWPDSMRHVECVHEQLTAVVGSPSWTLVRSLKVRGSPLALSDPSIYDACGYLKSLCVELVGTETVSR